LKEYYSQTTLDFTPSLPVSVFHSVFYLLSKDSKVISSQKIPVDP